MHWHLTSRHQGTPRHLQPADVGNVTDMIHGINIKGMHTREDLDCIHAVVWVVCDDFP